MKPKSIFFLSALQNNDGSTIVLAVIILAVVTILGISSITTSTTELNIARNDKLYKIAFYAAEAGRGYVPPNTGLYGGNNIDPDNADDTQGNFSISLNNLSFSGDVQYVKATEPPRGSGYEVSKFRSHQYSLISNGSSPQNTTCTIEAGFYRIGF